MKKKRKYTEAILAQRLLKILSKKNPCGCCPGSKKYESVRAPNGMWNNSSAPDDWDNSVCIICTAFIGGTTSYWRMNTCPCLYLGRQEAIKRTWIALEEKGYLD